MWSISGDEEDHSIWIPKSVAERLDDEHIPDGSQIAT